MKYKHIVWDWNGTLLDDRWLCIDAINSILEPRNMPTVSDEEYRDIFCFPVIEYYKKLGFDFRKEKFPIPGFLEFYKNGFKKCVLHDDALSVLMKIKQQGLTQSILSAGKQSSLVEWVKWHKIDLIFDSIVGISNEKADGKIKSGVHWLEKSGLPKDCILLVGDTIHDSEVSKKMGIDCVLVDNGHMNSERLKKTGHSVFSTLNMLFEYLYSENKI